MHTVTVPHIGKLIQAQVKLQKFTNAEFARRLYCDRAAINYLYKQQSIDLLRLLHISKILNYDFISECICPQCAAYRAKKTVTKKISMTAEEIKQLCDDMSISVDINMNIT